MEITEQQLRALKEMIASCAVFTTPLEHRRNWNEYKQDAQDRLNQGKEILNLVEHPRIPLHG